MTYITIGDKIFPINTIEEIEMATRALYDSGLETVPVYAGDPERNKPNASPDVENSND